MEHQIILLKYFEAIDRHLSKNLENTVTLLARIHNYTIRLVFPNLEFSRYAIQDMFVMPDTDSEKVDATFIWWEDAIKSYIWKFLKKINQNVFLYEDSTGFVETIGSTLRGEDHLRNKYYLLSSPGDRYKWPIAVHPFARAIFLWAQKRDMLMIHAAAIGLEGRGVLLVGHGGAGKSTLAVSCLLNGFDFISDDYCLMNFTGEREVYPIYTNISLNSDSLEKMPGLKPFEILPMQGEKRSFWVEGNRISRKLPIQAIILPQKCNSSEPQIELDESSKALGQVVYSTTKQLSRWHDTSFVKTLSQRLLGLPVYRFKMTPDIISNLKYLKKWMGRHCDV